MTIELLYFDGCPSHDALLPRLRELLRDLDVQVEIELRRVETPEAAEADRFLGSPTVRIDGRDVEPGAHSRTDFGLKCRIYRGPEGASPLPSDDWIIDALRNDREAAGRSEPGSADA
jgi:hypothetical protein